MHVFLDCEFNSFGGELRTMGMIREDGMCLYLGFPRPPLINDWVVENVMPIIDAAPMPILEVTPRDGAYAIHKFLRGIDRPVIISDWPADIAYFCEAIMTGPGMMVALNDIVFRMIRVQSYPTLLPNAVQHNSLWDAMALRFAVTGRADFHLLSN